MNPTVVLKNQFGEQTNNYQIGGSNQIDFNFVVDNTVAAGAKSLAGSSQVSSVFMHSSAPAGGNPNPIAGFAVIELAQAFKGFVKAFGNFGAPQTGSAVNISSGLTLGHVYQILTVGTSTAANWQALGLPTNVTPAVGVVFVATSASAGTGTGTVSAMGASGVDSVEVIGAVANPATGGGYIIVQFLANASVAAPAQLSTVYMSLTLQNPTAGPVL